VEKVVKKKTGDAGSNVKKRSGKKTRSAGFTRVRQGGRDKWSWNGAGKP